MGKNKEDIYINSNLIPPSPERDTILQNIFLSFGQPDASFLYQGAASTKLYEQLIHDPQYFPYQSSLDVIRNNRSTLQKFLGKKLLDYGSGTGEKAALLLQNSGRKLQYVPLDYSTEMMNEATTRLGKYPHINAKQGILINGESEDSLVTDIDDKTVLFSGGTSANFTTYENIRKLREMGNHSRTKGNQIFWDYFPAPSQEEIEQLILPAYDNDTQKARFENGLKTLGLSLDDFEFAVRYVKEDEKGVYQHGKIVFPGEIQAGFRAKKSVQLPLSTGNVLSVKAGEFYPLNISKRRSEAEIQAIFRESGAKVMDKFSALGMEMVVLKMPPSKLSQQKSKIRNALLAVLLLGAGIGIKSGIDAKVQRDREEQAKLIQYQHHKYFLDTPAKKQALKYFEAMYGNISSQHTAELQLLLESALVREITNGAVIIPIVADMEVDWGEGGIYGFLSKFVRENARLLAQWGISVGTPYEKITEYVPNFEKTLALQENFDLGAFLRNKPVSPTALPNPTDIIMKYGNNSPEFEQALQERREVVTAYEQWQQQHTAFQPYASLGKYQHSNGTVYHLMQLKNGTIVASLEKDAEKFAAYTSDNAVEVFQDYLAYFGGKENKACNGKALMASTE